MIDPFTGGIIPINKSTQNVQNINTSINISFDDVQSFSIYDIRRLYFNNLNVKSKLSLEDRIKNCLSIGEENITPEDLRKLLEKNDHPICYDGFEPSGRMHIAQGISKIHYVNKLTESGCLFVFWIADWFAMLNNKLGGNLKKIRIVGEYFIEIWKFLGMNMDNVRFLWASEEINKHPNEYWNLVMDISCKNTISRIKRCSQIMGRLEGDDQPCSSILYPCMQTADIFYLKADICQLGMDQRKVNMLAREYAEEKSFQSKPVIISHKMITGLQGNSIKMSKSDPNSAIFMDDSQEIVNRKIVSAFCPAKIIHGNPCIEYVEYVIFPFGKPFVVERKPTNGGDITYMTIEELKHDYESGNLHPGDLKSSLSQHLNDILEPLRKHFLTNNHAKKLYEAVISYTQK